MRHSNVADDAALRARRTPAALSRRRAMTILGAAAGLPLLCARDRPADAAPLRQWTGTSLGSPARLLIYHPDRAAAGRIVGRCAAEIERLERAFALYRPDSELSRLNRDGRLDPPSHDLLALLTQCQFLSELSDGAFDPTVQPLWTLYAAHFFGQPSPAPAGPGPAALDRARGLVDWQGVDVTPRRITLARPGMGLTLNGIAQGYVTDRVTGILRQQGCERVLANMGCSEIRAVGRHPDGRPWRVGLADPHEPEAFAVTLDLCDGAICTSGGYGTRFEPTGRFHHLFDPATGASASHAIAASVLAASATTADALSTALYVMSPDLRPGLLAHFPGVSALITRPDGTVLRLSA
ncbi:MAG: FAD:protein FMN transferase [Xanthobacteraceae bacterium]|jgi:thiamine biosynthesis lipoprotein